MCIESENLGEWRGGGVCPPPPPPNYVYICDYSMSCVQLDHPAHQTESTVAEDHKQYYHNIIIGYDFDHNHMQSTSDATKIVIV